MEEGYVTIKKSSKKLIEDSFKAFMSKHYSRGPRLAKVFITDNCITIHCKDILTSMEKNLLKDKDGELLIKIYGEKMIRNNESEFVNIINENIESTVSSYYVDFNIKNNSLACVFILDYSQ